MAARHCAIFVGCLMLSSPATNAEPPAAPVSVLSCALTAAERTSVPAMLAESNLSSKSSQLSTLTGLLAAAGRFDRAVELVELAAEPDRVIAPALAEIAIGALRAGNDAVADRVVARLSAMRAWTVPTALSEIVEALHAAGRAGDAVAVLQGIDDPAARAGALIDMARSSPAGSQQAEQWLWQALRAARAIRARMGHHVLIAGRREYLEDHGERASVLLDLAGSFAERGLIASARKVAAVIGDTLGGDGAIWKARALVAIGGAPAATGQAPRLIAEALETVEPARESTVGDTRDKVEILTSIARRFEDLGKQQQARQALVLAGSTADKLQRVDQSRVRTSIGVETLALLAGAFVHLGLNEQALAVLDQARALLDVFDIPQPTPSSSSSWDPVSSARHTRVKALVTIAAGREQAGRVAAGAAADAQLIAEIAGIADTSWRDSAWLAVASAYLGVERPQRALEILRAGKTRALDQLRAWSAIGESLLAADRLDDAAKVAREMPVSYAKFKLLASLAARLARASRGQEAERMITEVLGAGTGPAGAPAGRDRLLVAFAGFALAYQSPFLANPATAEQRQIMATHFGCR